MEIDFYHRYGKRALDLATRPGLHGKSFTLYKFRTMTDRLFVYLLIR
jgi:hypothetical protein